MRVYFCRKIKTGDSLFKQRLSPNKLINLILISLKTKKSNNKLYSYLIPIRVFAPLLLEFGIYAFFPGIDIPEDSL